MAESRSLITRHVQQFLVQGEQAVMSAARSMATSDRARERQQRSLSDAYRKASQVIAREAQSSATAAKKSADVAVREAARKAQAASQAAQAAQKAAAEEVKAAQRSAAAGTKEARERAVAARQVATAQARAATAARAEATTAERTATAKVRAHQRAATAAQKASREEIAAAKKAAAVPVGGGRRGGAATPAAAAAGVVSRGASTAKTYGVIAGVGAIAGAIKVAGDYDTALREVGAVSGATRKQLQDMGDTARDAGLKTGVGAVSATKAMGELAKAGVATKEIGPALRGTLALAQAGGLEAADAAAATANALGSFNMQGRDAVKVADAFANAANLTTADVGDFAMAMSQGASAAKTAGLDFGDTTLALTLLAQNAVKGSDAGTSLKAAITQLASPTDRSAELQKKLGLSFFDSAGNMKSVSDISGMLHSKLGGLTRQQRLQALTTLAGTDGSRALAAMMGVTTKEAEALRKKLEQQGSATDTASKKQAGFKGSMDRLKASGQELGITIGTPLANALADAADGVSKFITEARKNGDLKEMADKAKEIVAGVKDTTKAVVDFAQKHPELAKVAAGLLAVSVAVKAIRFAGAISGVSSLLRGLGKLTGVGVRAGSRLGSALGDELASSAASRARGGLSANGALTKGGIRGRLASVGRVLGATLGLPMGSRAADVASDGLGKNGAITGKLGGRMGIIGRALGKTLGVGLAAAAAIEISNGISAALDDWTFKGDTGEGRKRKEKARDSLTDPLGTQGSGGPLGWLAGKLGVGRTGGRFTGSSFIPRFANGGMVPALVSSGEEVEYGGRSMIVPGARVAADNVAMMLPVGAKVWTDHGQALRAAGMPDHMALAEQLPHFRVGGSVQSFKKGGTTKKPRAARVGFSVYDDPPPGAFGALNNGYAELGTARRTDGGATGHGWLAKALGLSGELPANAPLTVRIGGRQKTLRKRDRGYGQGGNGTTSDSKYALDIWKDNWKTFGLNRNSKGTATVALGASVRGLAGGSTEAALRSHSVRTTTDDLTGMTARGARRDMWRLAGPAVGDAFSQGLTAGRAGETDLRYVGSLMADARAAGRVNLETKTTTIAGRDAKVATGVAGKLTKSFAGRLKGTAGGGTKLRRLTSALSTMQSIGSKGLPYTYGGGHARLGQPGPGGPGFDCSGYVSAGLGAAGWIKTPMATQQGSGLNTLGTSGAGQFLTWGVRGSSGKSAHTMMKIGNTYWESGSGHGPRRVSGWSGKFSYRHMPGYAKGGVVGGARAAARRAPAAARAVLRRVGDAALDPKSPAFVGWGYRTGGRVGSAARTAASTGRAIGDRSSSTVLRSLFSAGTRDNGQVTDALDDLSGLLATTEHATITRLEALSAALRAAIRNTTAKSSAGGAAVTKAEQALQRRAQAALSVVDASIGLQVGNRFLARVDDRQVSADARQTFTEQKTRRLGIDEGSSEGLKLAAGNISVQSSIKALQLGSLRQALKVAQRRGRAGADSAKAIQEEMTALQDGVTDLAVQKIENARAQVVAAAGERVEAISTSVDRMTGAVGREQRRAGIDTESSTGLAQQGGLLGWTAAQQGEQVKVLEAARAKLTKAGQGGSQAAKDLDAQLVGLRDDTAETAVQLVENARAQVVAASTERVAAIGDMVERRTSAVGRDLRNAGISSDSSEGLGQQGVLLAWTKEQQESQLSAMKDARAKLTAMGQGSSDAARVLDASMVGMVDDIAETATQMVENGRAKLRAAAAEAVDASSSRASFASMGLTRLETQQKLDGTYEGGAAVRASYITDTVIPALKDEETTLKAQQKAAEDAGDVVGARQIGEAVYAKFNDILAAQLDAQELIAANTTKRTFGGGLALDYQNTVYTDSVLDSVGA